MYVGVLFAPGRRPTADGKVTSDDPRNTPMTMTELRNAVSDTGGLAQKGLRNAVSETGPW